MQSFRPLWDPSVLVDERSPLHRGTIRITRGFVVHGRIDEGRWRSL